jgi:hypothetical protein
MSKKITSPTDTRILLGAMGKMGEDSSRLTLAQMKEYIASNNSLTGQVAPVVNPAFQALSSVQVVLILEWIVLSVSTLKLDQPFTSEYLRNFAFSGIMVVSSIITSDRW